MNYIPGFSNYLQAAVPRYARGGEVGFDDMMYGDYDMGGYGYGDQIIPAAEQPYVEPYQPLPTAQPMTQEAAPAEAPAAGGLSYEDREARRIAANTPPPGTSIVGPYAGKKGLSFGKDNTFSIYDEQEVRVVDGKGNVIFTGVGVEGAKRAVAVAQSLSNDLGKNANFKIQKGENTIVDGSVGPNRYIDVAYAAPSQSGLGFLADNVLPFAAAFIPGIGPIAGAALGSAVSSAAQGRSLKDALVRAAIAGGSAYAGGQVFGPATSGATPVPGGNITSVAAPAIPTGAFDGILVNATRAVAPSLAGSAVGGALGSGLSSVTGYKTPAEKFAQQPSPIAEPLAPYDGINVIGNPAVAPVPNYSGALSGVFEPIATDFLPKGGLPEPLPSEPTPAVEPTPADDTIVVSGNRAPPVSGSGSPFGAAFSIPVNAMLSGAFNAAQSLPQQQPTAQEPTAEDIEAAKNPMVVTGGGLESLTPDEILLALSGVGGLAAATAGGGAGASSNVVNGVDQANGDIVVSKAKPYLSPEALAAVMASGAPTNLLPDNFFEPPSTDVNKKLTAKDIADYLRLASLGVSTVGGLLGDKGGGSTGTIPAGMGGLSSVFSKQLPTSTLLGGVGGGALPASTLASQGFNSPQNYYRYGYGPEQSFFDYATQGAPNTSRAYTGYEGTTAEDAFAPQPMRVATPPVALPQPITTPIPNNPAGPSMYAPEVDSMRFARGGFAVEGAGDGRDDKIPALLSDGEYVFDAETVALLGNGSNKAGAKLLDSFRVKVRKQKGKKLARGKFSDNAKRPEQYMAGGPA